MVAKRSRSGAKFGLPSFADSPSKYLASGIALEQGRRQKSGGRIFLVGMGCLTGTLVSADAAENDNSGFDNGNSING